MTPRLALSVLAALIALGTSAYADPGEGQHRRGGGPQQGMDGDWRGRDREGDSSGSGGRRFTPSEAPPPQAPPPMRPSPELSGGPPPEVRMHRPNGGGRPAINESGPEQHRWTDQGRSHVRTGDRPDFAGHPPGQRGGVRGRPPETGNGGDDRWTENGRVQRDWGRPEQGGRQEGFDPRGRNGASHADGHRPPPPNGWIQNDRGHSERGRNDWGRNDWGSGRGEWNDRRWPDDRRYHGAPGYGHDRRYAQRDRDRGRHWYSPGLYRDYYRVSYRFRAPPYRYPAGWYDRDWRCGELLPYGWYDPFYYLDWRAYGLEYPAIGCEWVRVGSSAVLIDIYSGRILSIAYDVFY